MFDLDLTFDLEEINFSIATLIFGLYLIFLGILYYVIFHKHHKRNSIQIDELITLVTKYYSLALASTVLVGLGIWCIINANTYKEDRNDVISWVACGIVIVSATVINFIFYIKKNLVDPNPVEREKERKRTLRIGEILELYIFTFFTLTPFWRIPIYIEVLNDWKTFFIEIVKSFVLSICSVFLLYSLNPINIRKNNIIFKKIKKL